MIKKELIRNESISSSDTIACHDTINKANSGHPVMALGRAPTLYKLFSHNLNSTPENSSWINRDRFVLASGHASPCFMLFYIYLVSTSLLMI